jgi:hypothetical protein
MRLSAAILFLIFTVSNAFSQLKVNAGRDSLVCAPYTNYILGGNPGASGGHPPYTYRWSCRFYSHGYWHSEFGLIDDKNLANPKLNENYLQIDATVPFVLTVTDSDMNVAKDTVNITISNVSFIYTVAYEPIINLGDSVHLLIVNILDGVPPFKYLWTPSTGISDPTLREPWAKPLVSTLYETYVTDSIGCVGVNVNSVTVLTTGIEKTDFLQQAIIRPHPVNANSRIMLNGTKTDGLFLMVFDAGGRLILKDLFYNGYPVGEKITGSGIFYYSVYKNQLIIASGKFIRK